jgi:hypothetical protein
MTDRETLTPPGDRVEYWSWGDSDQPSKYIEMVYVQDETVRISYNMFSVLLRQAGFKQEINPYPYDIKDQPDAKGI